MAFDFLRWNTTGAQPVTAPGPVIRVPNCNGFVACNTGDVAVRVNGQILYPGVPGTSLGDSKTWGGNFGEIYLGNIVIEFPTASADQQVTIDQKFYIIEGDPIIQNQR